MAKAGTTARQTAFRTLQSSFTGGEYSPRLLARMDLDTYKAGLALCRNFVVLPHGGVQNRSGTRFVAYVANEAKRPRLIPFRFSKGAGQAYVLEFGDLYCRVFMNGAPVLYSSGPDEGDPVGFVTPYTEADLPALTYVQSADVMTLTHPAYDPRELTRTAHDAWSLTTATFAPTLAAPVSGDITLTKGGSGSGTTWKYVVTWETESGEESLASPEKTQDHASSLSSTNYIDITAANPPTGAVYANVYRYRSGVFGWIGNTTSGNAFRDDGISPKLDQTPPRSRNPMYGANNRPAAVAYFQQRLAFGGSYNSPETLWLSQAGAYHNFSISEPLRDSDAITASLIGDDVDQIRHLVPLGRNLLILARSGVWTLARGDKALTPALEGGLNAEVAYGASLVRPLRAGTDCLYVQEGGHIVRAVDYSLDRDGLLAADVSILSEHLTRQQTILEWCWAQIPGRVVWAVRDDGVLLSLSYLKEEKITGWAWHDTAGLFESVATIPEPDAATGVTAVEDAVYVVVRRWLGGQWRRCIERFASRSVSDVRAYFGVDCGLSWDNPVDITGVAVDGDGYVQVTAPGHGLSDGDWIDLEGVQGVEGLNGRRLLAGLPITTDTFRVYVSGDDLDTPDDQGMPGDQISGTYQQGGLVRKAVSTVSGLDHLEGEQVSVLNDGSVEGPYTVTDGAVTLLRPGSRVHVGLGYTSMIRTLPIMSPASTEMRARYKRVTSLQLYVESSRGIFAGPTPDTLEEYLQRSDEALGDPTRPTTGMIELTIPATWNADGQVYVATSDPLPLEVLGVAPAFEVGSQ